MIYLKLFTQRIIKDEKVINEINSLNSDKDIMDYLQNAGFDLDKIIQSFEKHYGVKYIDLQGINIDNNLFTSFDTEGLRKSLLLPYDYKNGSYYFVSNNILKEDSLNLLRENTSMANLNVDFKFAFDFEIEDKYLNLFGQVLEDEPLNLEVDEDEIDEDFKVTRWVNDILNKGIRLNASDIHVESKPDGIQIRYRIDGILSKKEFYSLTRAEVANVIVRLKLISGMDISEKRRPQDGRISDYVLSNNDYDFRVSCINTNMGEKVVLRIFNRTEKILSFEELGFDKTQVEIMNKALSHQSGVIYVVGATGTGKTTTLYSMIDYLNSDEVNIYTVEDPIEREMENINQIQIDNMAGITFPSTLKSILRQDPDIIVVGEVRDPETADLSISSSLTGHLVISTLHANNAIDSISRLFEMDIEPFLLGTSSILFMSQKLVRVLCPECKKKVEELDSLEKIWLDNNFPKEKVDTLVKDLPIYEAVGCDKCSGGYKGRLAIGEFFEIDRTARELISKKKPINQIEALAYDTGYKPMKEAGLNKVIQGLTSIAELIRQLS